MKIKNKKLIFIILALLLFFNKDIILNSYKKSISFLGNKIYQYQNNKKNSNKTNLNIDNIQLVKSIINPGPLKNSSNNINIDDITLSKINVIKITNQQREKFGNLPTLKENSKLDFIAKKKLDDIFNKQYFEHISPSGLGVSDLADDINYKYIIIGENLALGIFENDKDLVNAWMASPGHRANILNKNYTEIGVAVGKGLYEGKKVWVAIQHFALPVSVCPKLNDLLKEKILSEKNTIKILKNNLSFRREKIDSGEVYLDLTTNEQINVYNELVSSFSLLNKKIILNINEYNKEIHLFNKCISKYTDIKTVHTEEKPL